MLFWLALFLLGALTGGVASVTGFGIGSFMTPVLATRTGFAVAVAAVGVAHLVGSVLRYWLLWREVHRGVLLSFGLVSGIGGLAGALLQGWSASSVLAVVFGGLMVVAGLAGIFRWAEKINITGFTAWITGAVSGFFGGLVGNQGGLRAAGLMGFRLTKVQFVATTTAVALMVDTFRVPVYLGTRPHELAQLAPEILAMSTGVIVGTLLGAPLLRRIPERRFRVILSVVIIIVGLLVAFGLR